MQRLYSLPYHLSSPWPDLVRPPTFFAKYSAEHKESWMAGTSPAKGAVGLGDDCRELKGCY
jgi:hypothetical protein